MRKLLFTIFPKTIMQILFFRAFGKFFNLKNPKTFYEKLLWLNYNKQSALKTQCADKYTVREYIIEKGYKEYLIELYSVTSNVKTIPYNSFPSQFILKCNHGANYNITCFDKSTFDTYKTNKILAKWLKTDFSKQYGELHYRFISRKIICEKYLGVDLLDYKVYCFNGNPVYIMVCTNRQYGPPNFYFYTKDWEYKHFLKEDLPNPHLKKPILLKDLLKFCTDISKPFSFVRVDCYLINNKIIFGEMTFTPSAFLDRQTKKEVNLHLGQLLDLKNIFIC